MDQSKPLLVAIVEDDAPSRTALGRLLRAAGFEPALVESAEAHIDASPEPTCIVVGVQLPGMSGIDLQVTPRRRLRTADHRDGVQARNGHTGACATEWLRRVFWKPVDGYTPTATIESITNP